LQTKGYCLFVVNVFIISNRKNYPFPKRFLSFESPTGVNPQKAKIVYCRYYERKGNHPTVKFNFLGYSFETRTAYSKKKRKLFIGYDCAISISSRKRIADKLEKLNVNKLTFKSIVGVAQYIDPMIRGWVRYYGKFKMYEPTKVFRLLSKRLVLMRKQKGNLNIGLVFSAQTLNGQITF